jgi:trans-aconitate methyltransferase
LKIKTAIDEFNDWAETGKDKGMENGHALSVDRMIKILYQRYDVNHIKSMLDLGCGNGWMLRKINSKLLLDRSLGVDGAPLMIEKAKEIDPDGNYYCIDINDWKPDSSFDLLMSMEFMYYLDSPNKVINNIIKYAANDSAVFIIGIDHYKENIDSLSWSDDLKVKMKTFSIEEWLETYKSNGLKDIYYEQFGATNKSAGTLIISGVK